MDKSRAAMCVYCGEAVIYETTEVTGMAAAHAKIVEHDQQCPRNPLVARIAALEKALEPFAKLNDSLPGSEYIGSAPLDAELRLARDDLRRAADLLKEKE